MRLTIRMLGLDVLDMSLETDSPTQDQGPGDCTTYPVSFNAPVDNPIREPYRDVEP